MWMNAGFLLSYVLLWLLVGVLTIVVLFLGKQVGTVYQRLGPAGAMMANPGPQLDSLVEAVVLEDIEGKRHIVGGARGRRSLLMFVGPGCPSCADLASGIRAVAEHEKESLDVILISGGADISAHHNFRKRHRLGELTYIISSDFRQRMNIATLPYALLLAEDGKLRSKGIVNSLSHLESLINTLDSAYRSVQERVTSEREAAASPANGSHLN